MLDEKDYKKLINILEDIVVKAPNEVILLSGAWGSGKTHLINKVCDNVKTKSEWTHNISHVSLFGVDSISELKQLIASPFLEAQYNNNVQRRSSLKLLSSLSKVANNVDSNGLIGLSLSLGETAFQSWLSKNLKNKVIIIDDIERKSSELLDIQLFGFVNYLKQNNNTIILIANEEEILLDNEISHSWKKLKEKVIDISFFLRLKNEVLKNNFMENKTELQKKITEYFFSIEIEFNLRIFTKSFNKILPIINMFENQNQNYKNDYEETFIMVLGKFLHLFQIFEDYDYNNSDIYKTLPERYRKRTPNEDLAISLVNYHKKNKFSQNKLSSEDAQRYKEEQERIETVDCILNMLKLPKDSDFNQLFDFFNQLWVNGFCREEDFKKIFNLFADRKFSINEEEKLRSYVHWFRGENTKHTFNDLESDNICNFKILETSLYFDLYVHVEMEKDLFSEKFIKELKTKVIYEIYQKNITLDDNELKIYFPDILQENTKNQENGEEVDYTTIKENIFYLRNDTIEKEKITYINNLTIDSLKKCMYLYVEQNNLLEFRQSFKKSYSREEKTNLNNFILNLQKLREDFAKNINKSIDVANQSVNNSILLALNRALYKLNKNDLTIDN